MHEEQIASTLLFGIRNKLLKPMAADINANTKNCIDSIIREQKKLAVILWCTVVGVLINFCGIIAVLYIVLK